MMQELISGQAAIEAVINRDANSGIDSAEVLKDLPSAQPEPCEDTVSRKAVEKMLKNGFPARGMWEIEGDVVKNAICETVVDLMMDLEKLPSAQPERKKGKWKRRIVDSGYNADWICSECGYRVKTDFVNYNFCPNCGADMRGEQDG